MVLPCVNFSRNNAFAVNGIFAVTSQYCLVPYAFLVVCSLPYLKGLLFATRQTYSFPRLLPFICCSYNVLVQCFLVLFFYQWLVTIAVENELLLHLV